MIRKFNAHGEIVEFDNAQVDLLGASQPIEMPVLTKGPTQTYVGEWVPGINHPTTEISDPDNPGQTLTIYIPVPEGQIIRANNT